MQIVICDDESYYREAITRAVQKWSALSDHRNVHCTTFASSEDLLERFVRADSSRTSEGSGLGLSIARSLTELQHGSLELQVDGDLFKVIISFARLAH